MIALIWIVSQSYIPVKGEEDDWEEMYYQENEQKVQIENELDKALQALEQADQKLLNLEENDEHPGSLRSNYDATLLELKSFQNKIDVLQRKLEAAAERENELNNLTVHIDYKINQEAIDKTQHLQDKICYKKKSI